MSSSSLVKRVLDGEEQILCHKCKNFRYKYEYSPNDTFVVCQICSDCLAHDYKEELHEFLEFCRIVEMSKKLTDETLNEILGDEYDRFKFLIQKYEL